MNIVIIGAGSLGSLLGGLLHLAGLKEVWLVGGAGSATHFAAIRQQGYLSLNVNSTVAQSLTFPLLSHYKITNLNLFDTSAELSLQADLALILVKSYQTEVAAQHTKLLLEPNGLAITLQNGLGNAERLAAVLGNERVCQGVTSLGAYLSAPGVVQFAGLGQTSLSTMDNRYNELVNSFVKLLEKINLPVSLNSNVLSLVWGKLVINCAINALTALHNCPNGELLTNPVWLETMDEAAREAARVAQAAGIILPYSDAVGRVREVAHMTAGNRTSMLMDVRNGRQTEIEAINGAVVRLATTLGVSAPVNSYLYREINRLYTE